jgi:sugar phosphate isomerase/epimerase
MIARNGFIAIALLVAAGIVLMVRSPGPAGTACAAAAEGNQKVDVGLQLYSLRAQFAKDVPGSLATVEKWNITDVEAAGIYNLTAEQFREALEKHHLHASGAHFQWDRLLRDLDGVIKEAKTLGCEYVTLPWIPHKAMFSEADATGAIERFNEWGQKLAAAGLKFTYHPHGYEFKPLADGSTLFDKMVAETKPDYVNYELDVFWAYDGGADPVKLMQKYPTRFVQLHLKDMNKSVKTPNYTGHEDVKNDVTLGTGQLDIKGILAEAQKIGIKHYYIEDESPISEEQIPQSVQYIRSAGY